MNIQGLKILETNTMRLRKLFFIGTGVLLALPFAAWASFKPIRALAPELLSLKCANNVCVDDDEKSSEAIELKSEAVAFVRENVGDFKAVPRVIFCARPACAKAYGFKDQGAYTVGTYGVVVGPRGWKPYFIRHELIHHLQVEHFGAINAWLTKPNWFMEGMAYSLSNDPRRPLPQPLEEYRRKFEKWQSIQANSDIWSNSAAL